MKVSEIMTRDPQTAKPDSTLEEIAVLMKDEDVGAIPIVDEDDELVGIVTDRDIILRCIADGKEASETTVEDILSEDLAVIEPAADVEEAARIMAEKQIRRLPVVEDGELVGMLSLGDISVKHDEEKSGEALQEISKGVKHNGSRAGKAGKKSAAASSQGREAAGDGNRQSGGTRAESALAKEFEENEEYDLEFTDEEEDAFPAARADEGRQGANLRGARGRQTGPARGRDTSISKRQPNRATLPTAQERHNQKTSAESSRAKAESKSGQRSRQGVTSRRSGEERGRQQRVLSIRDDAKAGSSKRRTTAKGRRAS